jgi:hypothetical protein
VVEGVEGLPLHLHGPIRVAAEREILLELTVGVVVARSMEEVSFTFSKGAARPTPHEHKGVRSCRLTVVFRSCRTRRSDGVRQNRSRRNLNLVKLFVPLRLVSLRAWR